MPLDPLQTDEPSTTKDVLPARKKLYVKTWGCQMNVYDSLRIVDVLKPLGFDSIDTPEDADMIVLNTCHIREKATEKLFSDLGRLKAYKDIGEAAGKRVIMAVAGCVAQAEGDVIFARAPYVDIVIGPQTYHTLQEMVAKAIGSFGRARLINTDFPVESKFDHLPAEQSVNGASAYLSVQEGCDKFCTFCVVPYTRGAEYSRPPEKILEEARRLIAQGVKEITLLGQNVNAYHGNDHSGRTWTLGRLIGAMSELDGLYRIRYTTSHPRDCDDDLITAHRDIPQLMPYLHLPVQSGSNAILKAMNRKHTAEDYLDIIEKFRKARPDIAISGDFIVGFPGETEADFEDTMAIVRKVGYASAYSFKYSPRPGTPAANMKNLVPEPVKTERLARLQDLIFELQTTFNRSKTGLQLDVLLDRKGKEPGQLLGRTPYNQSVYVTAQDRLLGEIVPVTITAGHQNSVEGKIVIQE